MGRRYFICFILVLVIVFLVLGNYIYNLENKGYQNLLKTSTKDKKTNLMILVEVDKKQLYLVDRENNEILHTYIIATGKSTSPTPLGTFNVAEKARWGEGFGSRWLGLNVPWGKYGIHGTNQPGSIGYNISGGCIRMKNQDIEELYELVSKDTIVHIENGDYGPFGHGFRAIKPGDRGSDVLEVQKRLSQKGYYNHSLDGIYGEYMKSSLINFLKDNNILLTDKISGEIYTKLGIILMD